MSKRVKVIRWQISLIAVVISMVLFVNGCLILAESYVPSLLSVACLNFAMAIILFAETFNVQIKTEIIKDAE